MNDFLAALALLTTLPAPRDRPISARAYAYFPLVGGVIGVLLVTANVLFRALFAAPVAAALVVALWVILTGALHLDGLADACDALFAATTRARRLEILRDVHLGAFGATGIALLLIAKFAAVSAASPVSVFLAPLLARWAMVVAAAYPPARSEGMAIAFRAGLTRREIFVATLMTAFVCVWLGALGVGALAAATGVMLFIVRAAINRLGGLTGDIYGMIGESVEVAVLIVGGVSI